MEASNLNDFTEEDDAALLTFIGMKDECPKDARLAWGAFYVRNRGYALKLAAWKYCPNRDEDRVESLVQETFLLVWKYAKRFDARGSTERDQVQRLARKWMGWLMRKAHGIILAKENGQPVSMEDLDLYPMPPNNDGIVTGSSRLEQFNSAFKTLSEREQHVVRTLAPYRDPKNPMAHAPDEVLKSLAMELRTTNENIRQIHRRARSKLCAAMDSQKQLASIRGGQS